MDFNIQADGDKKMWASAHHTHDDHDGEEIENVVVGNHSRSLM